MFFINYVFRIVLIGWEAIMKLCPDVYIDTSGYAFTLPLFKILGSSQVGCYIHYPTISTDMLTQVKSRTSTYNNNSRISNSWALSYLKLQYYKVFLQCFSRHMTDVLIILQTTIILLTIQSTYSSFLHICIVRLESIQT